MKTINCIIVDDEPQARKMMEAFVSQLGGWKILRVCSNAIEAFEALQSSPVDVIFLDIKMPIITGIDFLKSLKKPPLVIFTTAYNKYAMDGYELNVVDYLLKPISMHRLLQAAEKVSERLNAGTEKGGNGNAAEATFMFVKHDNKLVKINFADMLYVEGMQNFVRIHTSTKPYLITQTMKAMEEILPASLFTRVHKSYIVAINAITTVYGNTIEIDTTAIPIGSNYKADFMNKIES
ncbi:LytR/AlgR family response regulator transcription factor [Mucilaginibacter sp. FT3.2]|uniref:LytR/AlgR family response regulator transcription factor n=1 Tax=Mucilaginibacter sp. FT3.2 TaxID=2723090 RepID=UPI001612862E|nr:response regulator transcription factor [Mucilaginibacter sp. FT3.2]MBB6235027.1 DNA-binding LytR/AlgR family response regulator [Mucilaginibacter sp. FT3.2]